MILDELQGHLGLKAYILNRSKALANVSYFSQIIIILGLQAMLCYNHLTLWIHYKNSHRQYVNNRMGYVLIKLSLQKQPADVTVIRRHLYQTTGDEMCSFHPPVSLQGLLIRGDDLFFPNRIISILRKVKVFSPVSW